jgi:hypothetical protein
MRRREFIAGLGGAVLMPLIARAQPTGQLRRIGALMNLGPDDPEGQARLATFVKAMEGLGWIEGRTIQTYTRWGLGNLALIKKHAVELTNLGPDLILAVGALSVAAIQEASRTVPIVFASVTDPVGTGFVSNLSRPGGNATGFSVYEYEFSVKWLELLKQISPTVTKVGPAGFHTYRLNKPVCCDPIGGVCAQGIGQPDRYAPARRRGASNNSFRTSAKQRSNCRDRFVGDRSSRVNHYGCQRKTDAGGLSATNFCQKWRPRLRAR